MSCLLDRPFTYHDAVLAASAMHVDPAGAVNAVLVSVDAGIAVHCGGSWTMIVGV